MTGLDINVSTIYATNWLRAKGDTGLYFQDKGTGLRSPLSEGGTYGSVATYGNEGGWEGYSIGGKTVFMDNQTCGWGIYNDVNNEWMIYGSHNGAVSLYHNNSNKLQTTSAGVNITGSVTATSFVYNSDKRLKKNISTLTNSLENITKLRGVNYNWKSNGESEIGLIAQEVEEIYPKLVVTDEEGMKAVKYGNIVAILIEGVKELYEYVSGNSNDIEKLKKENDKNIENIEKLENDIKILNKKLDKLIK